MKQKYDVTGMTCSACSAHVEKAARAIPGVRDVTVNLLTNSMVIESDTQIANSAVIEAVSAEMCIRDRADTCPVLEG